MTVKLKQILVVIFLGSLGSGLWDLFLKDALFSLGNVFVLFFSYISGGYIDFLYSNVGARGDGIFIFPATLFFVFLCLLPFMFFIYLKKQIDKLDDLVEIVSIEEIDEEGEYESADKSALDKANKIQERWKKMRVFLLIGSILTSLLYIHITISNLSEYKAQNIVERRLEIIRPFIKEQDFYKLKSDSRLINDLLTLQKLINKTEAIAVDNNIKMPEFSLYGVTLPDLRN